MAKPNEKQLRSFVELLKREGNGDVDRLVLFDRFAEGLGFSLADLGKPVRFTSLSGRPGLFWKTRPVLVVCNRRVTLLLKPAGSPGRVASYLERGFFL